jgi:hypothetical protein
MYKRIFKLLIVFSVLFSISYYLSKWLTAQGIVLTQPRLLTSFFQEKSPSNSLMDKAPHTSEEELADIVNALRRDQNLKVLLVNETVCGGFGDIENPQEESIFSACKECTQAAVIKISSMVLPVQISEYFSADESARDILLNPTLTHMCLQEKGGMHSIYVMEKKIQQAKEIDPKPYVQVTPEIKQTRVSPIESIQNFTEDQLWQSLVDYRRSHNRNEQIKDEKICEYARKRVQDQLSDYEIKRPEEYPVPEKYPLDAHAGFAKDADSGYAFEVTGKNRLAENLAYWPGAEAPNHVIEWGWDTSTEGHKEAQLSNEYGSACISGRDGFYVAIFGN